jgi:carboxymethylenebutenolidase
MNLFQKYLVEEFAEDYQEGQLSRHRALKMIAGVTGSAAAANSILAACTPPPQTYQAAVAPDSSPAPVSNLPYAQAAATPAPASVSPDEADIQTGDLEFPGEAATLLGTLSRPAGGGRHAVVLVCHENRGLTEHIKDVTRRLAKEGYVALAVDLLSRRGGVGAFDYDEVPGALGNTPPEQFVQDFRSGWQYLQGQAFADAGRVGMVGFCFGGGVTWQVAVGMPELRAAVPFYGPQPAVEDVPRIQAAVLAIYGGLDERINKGIPAIEAAMQQNGKIFEKVIYPNAGHAFFNDTGARYNPEAAKNAWGRTLAWLEEYLS